MDEEGTQVEDGKPDEGTASDPGTPDKGDFEARLRNEPDFAIAQFKEAQSALTKAQQRLKQGEWLIQAAEQVGSGDLKAGAITLQEHIVNHSKLLGDQRMSKMIRGYLETGQVPDDYGVDQDLDTNEEDPLRTELQELRSTVARLESHSAKSELRTHVDAFFQSPIGKELTDEEKSSVMEHLTDQLSKWEKTPDGRRQLSTIQPKTIRLLALAHLDETDKLEEIGERVHLRKSEERRGRATDVPSGVASGRGTEPETKGMNVAEIMRQAARRYGIDLDRVS